MFNIFCKIIHQYQYNHHRQKSNIIIIAPVMNNTTIINNNDFGRQLYQNSQGPRHTKDVIKMVPVVPLFSTQHWKGKYWLFLKN